MIHGEYIRAYKNKNNPSPRNIIVLFLIFFYIFMKNELTMLENCYCKEVITMSINSHMIDQVKRQEAYILDGLNT